MKLKFLKPLAVTALAGIMVMGVAGCNKGGGGGGSKYTGPIGNYNEESDPLIIATLPLDGVFNPFFSTSATDGTIAGLTQISMLANDDAGKPVYGEDEAVVTLDYQAVKSGTTEDVDLKTTYYFVLKNDVKFSNGSPLTIKDVLFNYYVYLDPVYTGASTIYSTDIVGLAEYRTQQASEAEQKKFMEQFETAAQERIDALLGANSEIKKDYSGDARLDTESGYKSLLEEYITTHTTDYYSHIVDDFDKACELFDKEIETDYNNAKGVYQDTKFTNQKGDVVEGLIKNDVMQFLYNENFITWDKKANGGNGELTTSAANSLSVVEKWSEEQAKNYVKAANMPAKLDEVIQYWVTASELYTELTNQELTEYNSTHPAKYTNISGIKFANKNGSVEVNGKTYGKPEYESDGSVKDGYNEVLSITINNVDPKAVWNFAITVAPMYYYSSEDEIAKFDYESHFGVKYGDSNWMSSTVNAKAKNDVPVGAGPYRASSYSGSIPETTVPSGSDFYHNKDIVYYERNDHYVGGAPRIKYVRYKVTNTSGMTNSLYANEVDFSEPNAKPETIEELNGKQGDGIHSQSITTLGYGYIGINAGKVPNIYVRQAIMHSINTAEAVAYYKTEADAIYRSMSKESWAYPKDATPYYPYIGNGRNLQGVVPDDLDAVNPAYKEFVTAKGLKSGDRLSVENQKEFIKFLLEEKAGYKLNGNGVYQKGNDVCKFTFTIVGEETDHPAYGPLSEAGVFLNGNGFEINTKTDANGLQKLNSGALTVWAAAWGSTIDPDMYQVYHKDSKATSVLNWGYRQILQNSGSKYDTEYGIVSELSDLIDAARKIDDSDPAGVGRASRASIYKDALDLVMQLAVELPTYQRKDLFAYRAEKIDISTFFQNPSSFKGLMSDIQLVGFNHAVNETA